MINISLGIYNFFNLFPGNNCIDHNIGGIGEGFQYFHGYYRHVIKNCGFLNF